MLEKILSNKLQKSKIYFLLIGTIALVWFMCFAGLAFAKELKVDNLKNGESVYTGVDGSGGYEARMFDKNGADLYNKNGPKIVTTYDANGNAVSVEEWAKEKRMYVKSTSGDLANVYCVQHGTLFGVGSQRITEDIRKIMDQTTLNKIVAAIDYIRSTGVSGQEEYFAVQSYIWSLQDGNESFGYSFSDANNQKHPYEAISKVILNQQSDYYYGDYHGEGKLFGSSTEQDVGMFDYTKDTDKNARINTTARNEAGDSKNIIIDKKAIVVDRVEHCGLLTTKEYTLKGTLMRRPSAEALKVDDKAVNAEVKFTPKTTACATVNVKFEFDASALKDDELLVAYEELWRSGRKILEHKDIFDNAQTVRMMAPENTSKNSTNVKVKVVNNLSNNSESKAKSKSNANSDNDLDNKNKLNDDSSYRSDNNSSNNLNNNYPVHNTAPYAPRTGFKKR